MDILIFHFMQRCSLGLDRFQVAFDDSFKMKTYLLCFVIEEDGRHVFITCLIAKTIWVLLTKIILSSF